MISASNMKNGTTFAIDGVPFKVIKYTHTKIARGGATIKLKVRNLKTAEMQDKTLSSTTKVDEINTTKKNFQLLYVDGANAVFMDPTSYEQVEIPTSLIKDEIRYIKEGSSVEVLFWTSGAGNDDGDKPLSVDIPPKVALKVVKTTPGVKGNSATNVYKSALLENDLEVKVPLFVKEGELVRIDTRTGEYVERVSR